MTELLDLPDEVLLVVAAFVAPVTLCWPAGHWKRPRVCCRQIRDLHRFRSVCRRLRGASEDEFSRCLTRRGGLAVAPVRFQQLMQSIHVPRALNHLHVGDCQHLPVYLEPFAALELIHITELHPEDWASMIGPVLGAVPTLRTVLLDFADVHVGPTGQLNPPATPRGRLDQVTKLGIADPADHDNTHALLEWFPRVTELSIIKADSWRMPLSFGPATIGRALHPIRRTLKILDLTHWQIPRSFEPEDANGVLVDLRNLVALKEIVTRDLLSYAGRPDNWRLPASLERVRDPAFGVCWEEPPSGARGMPFSERLRAMDQLALRCSLIAPGLKELSLWAKDISKRDAEALKVVGGSRNPFSSRRNLKVSIDGWDWDKECLTGPGILRD